MINYKRLINRHFIHSRYIDFEKNGTLTLTQEGFLPNIKETLQISDTKSVMQLKWEVIWKTNFIFDFNENRRRATI